MKAFKFMAAAVTALACLWACNPDDVIDTPVAEISVSPAAVTFEADGGTLRVAITTNVDNFSVSGNPDWLTFKQNGKELELTAAANTVNQPRSCELTLSVGDASAKIAVSQKAGSPYPGFTVCSSASFEYAGTMLYQFLKPTEEDYGGNGYIGLTDEDQNGLSLWVYTELFESEEEVELTPGKYVKGTDAYPVLAAKKLTFAPGVVVSEGDDEEDPYIAGCYFIDTTGDQWIPLVDGSIEVSKGNDGTYTIKADMVGSNGKAYKYVYSGNLEIDASGASYPGGSERIDVGNTVFAAECYYMGDEYENGTTAFDLILYSGDPEDADNAAVTNFRFVTDAKEFSDSIDLTGEYGYDEENPYAAGSAVTGELVEIIPGFSMPMGSYVMYGYGDYLIADAYVYLSLEKQADGKYTLIGSLMSSDEDMVLFMGEDFTGIKNLEIAIVDGTKE